MFCILNYLLIILRFFFLKKNYFQDRYQIRLSFNIYLMILGARVPAFCGDRYL
jgi:hypothetical protein